MTAGLWRLRAREFAIACTLLCAAGSPLLGLGLGLASGAAAAGGPPPWLALQKWLAHCPIAGTGDRALLIDTAAQ